MNIQVYPGKVKGTIQAPASKSMMQRACAGALLHKGKTIIHNAGDSSDDRAALGIIEALGAGIQHDNNSLIVESKGIYPITQNIFCGESGLSARLFTIIAALHNDTLQINGTGSLIKRPMNALRELFRQTGVIYTDTDGHLPLSVKGPLQIKDIELDGSISSQFLSGVLFAFAFSASEPVTVTVKNLTSKPYIDLTLEILGIFGVIVKHEAYERFLIVPAGALHESVSVVVEGDWSNAAFWLIASAINGKMKVEGLRTDSLQADKKILEILQRCGADITITGHNIDSRQATLKSFSTDLSDSPDLFPVLSILATQCAGISTIKGLHRLIHKESNRQESIVTMLNKFGVAFSINEDTLIIPGIQSLHGGDFNAPNDHRMVMAITLGALNATTPVTIHGTEAINKSYPSFFHQLAESGINLSR